MNNVSLITKEGKGKVFISGTEDSPSISYINSEGTISTVSDKNSKYRPIYISELNNKLLNRIWNTPERRFVSNDDFKNLMLQINTPNDYIESNQIGVKICNLEGIDDNEIEKFREEFKDILDNMTGKEINFYNSSKKIIDVLNNSITIDLLSYNSDSYTNTISLRDLAKNFPYPGISGKVDLSVQYSKNGNILNYDTTFEGFNFVSNDPLGNLEMINSNFTEKITEDIIIEYINNVIRVIPLSSNITECIISNCTITYGNIK